LRKRFVRVKRHATTKPFMSKVGRPKAITKELEKTIAELFWLAFTDAQVALFTDLSVRTIERMRTGEYCRAIKKAEIKRESIYRKKIWSGREGWQGAAWSMERKYPGQFSKPEVQLNLNMQHNETHQTLIIAAEAAKEIGNRVHQADAKFNELLKLKNVTPNGNGHHPEAKNG